MSRKQKFKFWDNFEKTWLVPEECMIDFKGQVRRYLPDKGDMRLFDCDSDIILVRSTGLQDKNGVDIYEGDILDLGQTVNGVNEFIVLWDSIRVCWGVRYNAKMNTPRNYEYDIEEFFRIDENTDEGVSVIGNIHANPELLKEDK